MTQVYKQYKDCVLIGLFTALFLQVIGCRKKSRPFVTCFSLFYKNTAYKSQGPAMQNGLSETFCVELPFAHKQIETPVFVLNY
jgi:hypothetical protein